MDRIAAMKNVLSPSSETMITARAAKKPWTKLSSPRVMPFLASSSAGERAWGSLVRPLDSTGLLDCFRNV